MRRRLESLRPLLADLRCQARRLGVRAAVRNLLSLVTGRIRAFVSTHETYEILFKPLSDASAPAGAEFRVERVGPHHAAELQRLRLDEDPCDSRRSRYAVNNLRAGYHGFVVRRDAEIVGHLWWVDRDFAPGHHELPAYRIELADGDTYGFGYRLAQQTRGGGTASDVLSAIEAELAKLGYERMWGSVDVANTPARWTYIMGGWTVSHTVERVRRLGVWRDTVAYRDA